MEDSLEIGSVEAMATMDCTHVEPKESGDEGLGTNS